MMKSVMDPGRKITPKTTRISPKDKSKVIVKSILEKLTYTGGNNNESSIIS